MVLYPNKLPESERVCSGICILLTSHGKLYSADFDFFFYSHASVRPPRIRVLTFNLMSASFTLTIPNSYRALVCFATLPTVLCLI